MFIFQSNNVEKWTINQYHVCWLDMTVSQNLIEYAVQNAKKLLPPETLLLMKVELVFMN